MSPEFDGEQLAFPKLNERHAGISDLDMALRTANYFLGEVRYPEHNQRMLEMHEEFDTRTPGMEMTVAIHDLVDHGLIHPEDEETRTRVQGLIYDLWDRVEDTGQLYYALGCAFSQSTIEETVAENWRKSGIKGYADRPEEEQRRLAAAINKDNSVEVDEKLLRSAGVYELDTSSIKEAMDTQNVEGFLNGAIELLDNFNNPPPDPRAVWRDCIEALSCYYPALVFFGAKKLATDLRGKALEWFHQGTPEHKKALNQRHISERHFGRVQGIFSGSLEEAVYRLENERREDVALGDIPKLKSSVSLSSLEVEDKLKTVGSATKKFLDPRYKDAGVELLPDGIGFRIVVPDRIGGVGAIYIGKKVKDIIAEKYAPGNHPDINIRVAHPHPNELAEEDYINDPKPSGYKSYHVVFMAEIGGETVPFEIQTVTQEQEWHHTLGVASEVLRKMESEPLPRRLEDMSHIGKRREHLTRKTQTQQLIPHTWIDITKNLPELDSPVNRTYSLVETGKARIMAPPELAEFITRELPNQGLEGDVFLPPAHLTLEDFTWMIGRLDPNLLENEQIQDALGILMSQDLPSRHSGAGQLEEHLLPTAFHATLLAAHSVRHWDAKDSSRLLSDTVTVSLLHDIIEDIEDEDEKEEMRIRIQYTFGNKIATTVDSLTSPQEIEDDHQRRSAYARQLEEEPAAFFVKLSDRMQNHTVDLVRLASSEPTPQTIRKIHQYFVKTLTYLSPSFEGNEMPEEYKQVHRVVMTLAKTLFNELPYEVDTKKDQN